MRSHALWVSLAVACVPAAEQPAVARAGLESVDGGYAGAELGGTRLLRRLKLTLVGQPPTDAELAAVKAASDAAGSRTEALRLAAAALDTPAFYDHMLVVGRDFLRTGPYVQGQILTYFNGDLSADLGACPSGTLHAGRLVMTSGYSAGNGGDPAEICDDAAAPIGTFNPWWAPSTTVQVIGRAASGAQQSGPYDCGRVSVQARKNVFADAKATPCSCGPNLIYCLYEPSRGIPNIWAGDMDQAETPRRQLFEEPSRLFAHLAWHDRPMTDLVAGNYTVAPLMLRHMYVRAGRQAVADDSTDSLRWWDPATWAGPTDPYHDPSFTPGASVTDPLAWTEVVPAALNVTLLSLSAGDRVATGADALARSYRYDPRTTTTAPDGVASAGVLTTLSAWGVHPRERVRGARWMEVFACRSYAPPTPEQAASLGVYLKDPATEGVCQHCHRDLDLAATYFKRWGHSGAGDIVVPGIGRSRLVASRSNAPFSRWAQAFDLDTVMTPVTSAQAQMNPDAIYIDFLPTSYNADPNRRLFGQASDGTTGPLGFGRALVASGTFDRCFAKRTYELITASSLDLDRDAALINELAEQFVASDRKLRPYLKLVMARPELKRGL